LCERGGGIPLLAAPLAAPAGLTLIVGAEGGFSAAEVDAARHAGCLLIDAGPRILRAETAAIAALSVCQARWGDAAGSVPPRRSSW
ncbi:MAG: RsmE family RNA methyltransferase, partial [Candidatus Binatia bacterium]